MMKAKHFLFTCLLFLPLIGFAQINLLELFNNPSNTSPNHKTQSLSNSSSAASFGDPPAWKWINSMESDNIDLAAGYVEDADGNFYTIGSFSGDITIDGTSLNSVGFYDMFLAKISSNGNLLWLRSYHCGAQEELHGVDLDIGSDGALYATGYFYGTTNAASIGVTLFSEENQAFIAKLDTDGDMQWFEPYALPNSTNSYGNKIIVTTPNQIYTLIGNNSSILPAGTLVKYDGSTFTACPTSATIHDFELVNNDHIYITGEFVGNGTFNNLDVVLDEFFVTTYIAKSNLDFFFDWVTPVTTPPGGNTFFASGIRLAYDANENFYFAGVAIGTLSFAPLSTPLEIPSFNPFLAKIDSTGDFLWARTFPTTNNFASLPNTLVADPNNRVIQGGSLNQVAILDDGTVLTPNSIPAYSLISFSQTDGATIEGTLDNSYRYQIGLTNGGNTLVSTGYQNGNIRMLHAEDSNDWTVTSEGSSGSFSNFNDSKLIQDDQQNHYLLATASGKIEYQGFSETIIGEGLHLSKTNADGNAIWTESISSTRSIYASSQTFTLDGQILVTGQYNGTAVTDNGTYPPIGLNNGFLARFDQETGAVNFFKTLGDGIFPGEIKTDEDGEIIISGRFSQTINLDGIMLEPVGTSDLFLAKYSAAGDIIWAERIGTPAFDSNNEIAITPDQHIHLVLNLNDNMLYIGNQLFDVNLNDGDLFLIEYDNNGIYQNHQQLGAYDLGFGVVIPDDMISDTAGNLIIHGEMGPSNSFAGVDIENPYYIDDFGYDRNLFTTKIDAQGNVLWAKGIFQKEYLFIQQQSQIDTDDLGNIYVSFGIIDSTYIQEGVLIVPEVESTQSTVMLKYDASGALVWAKSFDSPWEVKTFGVKVLGEDRALMHGYFSSALEVDDFVFSTGTVSPFMASTTEFIVNTHYLSPVHFELTAAPNPSTDYLRVDYTLDQATHTQLSLIDLQGRVIETFPSLDQAAGPQSQTLSTSSLPVGMYLLRLQVGEQHSVLKFEKL